MEATSTAWEGKWVQFFTTTEMFLIYLIHTEMSVDE
jgi:hypothetical protein